MNFLRRIRLGPAAITGSAIALVACGSGGAADANQGLDAAAETSADVLTADGTDGTAADAATSHIASITVGAAIDVLGPNGGSINGYGGLRTLADEHSTVFPPSVFPQHLSEYLFFVPTMTSLNTATSGLVVLTAGAGPSSSGQWTLDFASDYGLYDPSAVPGMQNGQIFIAPVQRDHCPTVSTATMQDTTFDLNYANAGSVLLDPTAPAGSLLMVYEGTTLCIGATGGTTTNSTASFYSTIGIATSTDRGHSWPTYRNNFTMLPTQSLHQGPNAPASGAFGSDVCVANDCTTTPAGTYGRYPVLSPTYTIAQATATGAALPSNMGDSAMSAFVDDEHTANGTYVYSIFNHNCPQSVCPLDDVRGGLMLARAPLNGGSAPLHFTKWYGPSVSYAAGTSSGSFAPASVQCTAGQNCTTVTNDGLGIDGGGLGSPIFPMDPSASPASFQSCQSGGSTPATLQGQSLASISYVEPTHQYLILFLCHSRADPANPTATPPSGATQGVAFFYSTLDADRFDLSQASQWIRPREIGGSWQWLASNGNGSNCVYDGWYPTAMSLAMPSAHLGLTGYVFTMFGCTDSGAGAPRQYMSRPFTITAGP